MFTRLGVSSLVPSLKTPIFVIHSSRQLPLKNASTRILLSSRKFHATKYNLAVGDEELDSDKMPRFVSPYQGHSIIFDLDERERRAGKTEKTRKTEKPHKLDQTNKSSSLSSRLFKGKSDKEERRKESLLRGEKPKKPPPERVVGFIGDPIPTEARFKHKEHKYSTTNFRISPRKLTFLARQVAGKNLDEAIKQMEFSPKKASKKIMNSLITARDHAWRYKMMEPRRLYIEQAWVGKGVYRKRINYHSRGRFSLLKIKKAHMKYIIKEGREDGSAKPKKDVRARNLKLGRYFKPEKEDKPIYNPPTYYNW
ncbi:1928_t:CDS:2 [Ambispora leptoticha]|uniref:1928_t:CDS:1 n=1 Tax=Ambispora leptoticha TaxID=144679 RepID=A0A9N9C8G6_9GLOM|nr:1928_t:CDS:2 [Ambispora leptoticha]